MTPRSNITAYPLSWPLQWPRTPAHERKRAPFGKQGLNTYGYSVKKALSVNDGYQRLEEELYRLGAQRVVISTNIELRKDGQPYANRRAPGDVGVAVYFSLGGTPHCLPCDRWDRVADNLAAVAAHIGALRGIERWGVGDLKAAFAGFKALPERGSGRAWYEVLGVDPGADEAAIRRAYRRRAMETHPDRGGSKEAFQQVQEALRQGLPVRADGQPA